MLGLYFFTTHAHPHSKGTTMSKIENIKNHVRENKKAYIAGGTVVGVGAAVGIGYILGVRTTPKDVETLIAPSNTINGVAWKPTQTIEVYVEALGDPGNIVQDLTTGTIYASQRQAATALGVHPGRVSDHLNGRTADVCGHILKKLGKAAVAESA